MKYYIFQTTTRTGETKVEFQAFYASELNDAFSTKELAALATGKVVTRKYKPTEWVVQTKIATVEAAAKALGM